MNRVRITEAYGLAGSWVSEVPLHIIITEKSCACRLALLANY